MLDTKTLLHDRYSIVHIEGTGNFNKVFFALDMYQNPPQNCVIKVFKPIGEKNQVHQWIEGEFQKEAKLLKQISLENSYLPEIYHYFSDLRVHYIVRELIVGKTLRDLVQTKGTFSISEVRELVLRLLSSLTHLHKSSAVHQNIKPQNIILRDGDRAPMLINFGSIEKIMATYDFCNEKQIFSTNNVFGYAPPERALGKSVPTSDLYSLGLTAIYLLTGKNPVDLAMDDSGNLRLPEQISSVDSNFAGVISRAIGLRSGDRYGSAKEMLEDLSEKKYGVNFTKTKTKQTPAVEQKNKSEFAGISYITWEKILLTIGSVYIFCLGIIACYDWYLTQNSFNTQIYNSLTSSSDEIAESIPELDAETQELLQRSQTNLVEIPIFLTGTSKQELRKALGEPNAIQKGYWSNSSAWIYKNWADRPIDMGYLFDLDTEKLRQTEVAIDPSVDLKIVEDILTSLLREEVTPEIALGLQRVYNRQANEYLFKLGKLEGSIQREADGHIYLGVWEADFH